MAKKLNVNKATSYPKIDVGDEYFVIEISDIVFDKSLASVEILQELEEDIGNI